MQILANCGEMQILMRLLIVVEDHPITAIFVALCLSQVLLVVLIRCHELLYSARRPAGRRRPLGTAVAESCWLGGIGMHIEYLIECLLL